MTIEPLTTQLDLLVKDHGLADVLHALVLVCVGRRDGVGPADRAAWAFYPERLAALRDLAAGTWAKRGEAGPPLYPLPEPPDAGPPRT